MLTFEQIKELIELVSARGLDGLELERAGFRFKIDGRRPASEPEPGRSQRLSVPSAAPAATSAPAPAAVAEVPHKEAPAVAADEDLHTVTSPIVGTFYRAPSPDSEPFAEVGDRVEKGQVLCIIEAMKLMNEIESDVAGEIVEIRPKNAQAVEFGEPLFVIRPR